MTQRVIYELVANGSSVNGWSFHSRGAVLFESRAEAEADVKRFKAACVDREHFECAEDDDSLKIQIVERRLQTLLR